MKIKYIDEVKNTTNSRVYNLAMKVLREKHGEIRCSFCPYHRYDNDRARKSRRSWKSFRRTQYKEITNW